MAMTHGLRQLDGVANNLIDEERRYAEALRIEYDQIAAQYHDADEQPAEVDQRNGKIEAERRRPTRPRVDLEQADLARPGGLVSIDHDGQAWSNIAAMSITRTKRCREHSHAEREIGLFKRQEAGGGLLCMLGMGHSLKEWSSMRRPSSVTCVLLCSLENSKPPSSSSIS